MANPIFRKNFEQEQVLDGEPMSINGTITKSVIMISLIVAAAAYTWSLIFSGFVDKAGMLGIGGFFAAFIAGLIVIFAKPRITPVLSIIYSVGEGLFLGVFSAYFEKYYPGIVLSAVICTFGAMFMMLLLYRVGAIKCTEKFRAVIFTATSSVLLIYIIQIVASLFGRSIPQIFTASITGIVFSVIVTLIAAFNFIVDFDFIERGSAMMLPKLYEWIGATSLMFSLVWLYMEMIRLLAKVMSRR
ncbi:MAG: Bax inhibitor-1/YccA family protein [Candidatus Gastranaerophilaceae bacterium]|nr:Bax inhibitor-1/YccA family protein [Candidatus Gastranaerophilaceae bacterium]